MIILRREHGIEIQVVLLYRFIKMTIVLKLVVNRRTSRTPKGQLILIN